MWKEKLHFPMIYFADSAWTSVRNPPFDLNLKALRVSNCFISLGTKSYIFEPRYDTDSVSCQTEFYFSSVKQIVIMMVIHANFRNKKLFHNFTYNIIFNFEHFNSYISMMDRTWVIFSQHVLKWRWIITLGYS